MKTVGVLGGMGPFATVDFFSRLVHATPGGLDQEHLHIIIDNNPGVPDRTLGIAGKGPSPGPELARMARRLEQAGADFLVMPCNTAHAFAEDICAATRLPFLDMIEQTVRVCASRPAAKKIGLLATDGCLMAGLYQKRLADIGQTAVTLHSTEQRRLMDLLYHIKAGEVGENARHAMRELANVLIDDGADHVIAACTEVPLVLDASMLKVPLLVSTDVLVVCTIEYARGAVAS